MTNQKIINAVATVIEDMRKEYVPRDTGNMADNALKMKVEGRYIIVYIDTKIAPYVPYTNEPWISPRWHGKKNPNEAWWETFAQIFSERLSAALGGTIK